MYPGLEKRVAQAGANLMYLPPYSPQLIPIQFGFGLLKKWIQRHAFLAFHHDPESILDVAFRKCMDPEVHIPVNVYSHCGYSRNGLRETMFFKE